MQISVTIRGLSPLLMNRFTEKSEIKSNAGTSAAFVGQKPPPRDQAAEKAYADEKGNLFLPGPNVMAAIVSAGRFHKAGKSKITTVRSSLVPAGVWIGEMVLPLGTKKFEVDSRSVVIPSTGGRIMCHRPRLDEWQVTFTLDVDTTLFAPAIVRALVDDAGKRVGVGDFRPERKGPFGRFQVVTWKEAA